MCDSVSIINFDGSRATKSFKGNFSCKVIVGAQELVINECSYFDTGEKKWVHLPSRKMKDDTGKWISAYPYVQFTADQGRFEHLALAALKEHFLHEEIYG